MIRRTKSDSDLSGFTLLEICIVMAILLTSFSAGFVYMRNWKDQLSLRFTVESFVGELHRARVASIACGFPVQVAIGEGKRSFRLHLKGREDVVFSDFILPECVQFLRSPGKPVVFYSSGSCVPSGSYEIGNGKNTAKIVISIMGRVRWEYT